MINRLKRGCVVLVCLSSVLMACGDDEGASSGSVATAGSSGSGFAANARPVPSQAGSSGRRGTTSGQMCPMTEAEATGTCTPARGSCMFGERTCDCITETMSWACWSPSDCPTTVPAEQSACNVVGMTCSPAQGDRCECTQQGWDCGNQFCPPDEPASGAACDGGDGSCTYGARTCDCSNSLWVCWSPASDCPAVPPPDRMACPLQGVSCAYEGGNCSCGSSGWRCGRGVMNDPEEDAGVPQGGTGTAGASAGAPATGGAGASAAGVGAGAGSGAGAGAGGMSGAGSAGMSAGTSGAP